MCRQPGRGRRSWPRASFSARTAMQATTGRPSATSRQTPRRGQRRRRGCGRRRGMSVASRRLARGGPGTVRVAATSATSAASSSPRKASAAARARAKFRRWKRPGARSSISSPGILGGNDQLRPPLRRRCLRQGRHLGTDPTQDQSRVVAQNRQLLGRDLKLGLAQPVGVVEPDRGQDRDPRGDRVGRVQPPAQPGLDDRGLDPGGGEGDEGGGRRNLELGHRLALLQAAVDRLGRLRRCAPPPPRTRRRRSPRRRSAPVRTSAAGAARRRRRS